MPNLRACSLNVRLAIRYVIELIRPDSILKPLGMALRLVIVVLRVIECDRGYRIDFSAEQSQQVNLALRLRVWHVDD